MIRTLVETEADDAQDAGDITPKQKAAVHFINGHSSTTAKRYYVKKSVAGQVESSRNFFEGRGLDVIAENDGGREFHMAGEGDVLSDNASDSDSSESPGHRAPWGADHPCQDPLRERVPFSSQELELIAESITALQLRIRVARVMCVKKILQAIR